MLAPAKWDIEGDKSICDSLNQLNGQPYKHQNGSSENNLSIKTTAIVIDNKILKDIKL